MQLAAGNHEAEGTDPPPEPTIAFDPEKNLYSIRSVAIRYCPWCGYDLEVQPISKTGARGDASRSSSSRSARMYCLGDSLIAFASPAKFRYCQFRDEAHFAVNLLRRGQKRLHSIIEICHRL
jgi:hypothetical protein